jgi:hypothetical protein
MAKYNGSGWHKQSIRHSRARKYGKAGGRYANKRVLHYGKIEGKYKYLGLGAGKYMHKIRGEGWQCQMCGFISSNKGMVISHFKKEHAGKEKEYEKKIEQEEHEIAQAEGRMDYGKSEEPETMFFNSHKIKIMKAETNEPTKFKFTIDDYYTGFGNTRKEAINNAKAGIKDIDDAYPPTLQELKETFPSDFKAGKKIYTKIDGELYSYTEGKQAKTMKKEKNLKKIIRGQVTQANFNLFA